MFPYKIRKPAWGSLKPKETKRREKSGDAAVFVPTSHLGGDPNDPHTVGGNLQRAILLDLIDLRHKYSNVEVPQMTPSVAAAGTSMAAASASARGATRNNTSTTNNPHRTSANHASLGSSFARFKSCFSEARFGAIHTRTIPPRVDRGEYIQLLYSSCFYLLEESFKCSQDNAEALSWENNSHPNSAFNAIYAAFILYTLHKTNVLPEAPSPRSHTKRTKSGRFDEQSLKEAWSMLPIGINSEGEKTWRRAFRSPVRIDRWNYSLLLRLRDLCLARVEQCGVNVMENTNSDDITTDGACNNTPWQCHCGLARDAARVIDKMLFDDTFFQYCEYHGPHCLEGLAGHPNFYRAYFVKEPPVKKKAKRSKKKAESLVRLTPVVLAESELTSMGNEDDGSLDLSNLSKMVATHRSNVTSVMTQLQKSRIPGAGELQPKQRELVENTLSGIIKPSSYSGIVASLDSRKDSNAESNDVSTNMSQAKSPPEAQHAKSKQVSFLTFPETFSYALCDQIRGSLFDFKEEADMIRKAVVRETKVRMKKEAIGTAGIDVHPELACFDDLASISTQQKRKSSEMSSVDDVQSMTTDQRRRKRRRERDSFLELQREKIKEDGSILATPSEKEDEVSIATGAGRNALLSLLSMAEGDNDEDDVPTNALENEDECSIATGGGKNALLSLLSMAKDNKKAELSENDYVSSDDGKSDLLSEVSVSNIANALVPTDDASIASGMGKRALQFLLTQSKNGQGEKKEVRTTKTRVGKKAPRKKSPSQSTAKSEATKKCVKPKSSKKRASSPAPPTQFSGSKSVKKEDSCDDEEDNYQASSLNASAATGMSSDEEFSIATEGAGRNALASLLSNAKYIEHGI